MLRTQAEKDLLGRFSSFTVVENTLRDVVELLLKSERLKRLLYYTDPKALHLPKLTPSQTLEVLQEQIKIVPKLNIDPDAKPYLMLSLDKFTPSEGSTSFRFCQLDVDIICSYDFWNLEDFKLRPYAIAGEVDALINKSNLTGLGLATFGRAKNLVISPEIGGLTLQYLVETLKDDLTLHESADK